MNLIQPYDLKVESIDSLLYDKQIYLSNSNKSWRATIFPKSTPINNNLQYDKDHIVTQIDDELFVDFVILKKLNETVYLENNTKRDFIKSKEIGDFTDSVKRYTQLDKPIDYNENAQQFLNIPQLDYTQTENLNIDNSLIYKSDVNTIIKPKPQKNFYSENIKHPHINTQSQNVGDSKYNNKAIIKQVLLWAKEKGIKYIYCINEYRPMVINNQYVSSYVYYTIKGSY